MILNVEDEGTGIVQKDLLKSKSPTFLQVRAGMIDGDQQLRVH